MKKLGLKTELPQLNSIRIKVGNRKNLKHKLSLFLKILVYIYHIRCYNKNRWGWLVLLPHL